MALIIALMLFAGLCKIAWDLAFRKLERRQLIEEYQKTPKSSLFVFVWMVFFVMFFGGVIVPFFGQISITDDGWQVWEVGFFGTFGMWLINLFVDINKWDNS